MTKLFSKVRAALSKTVHEHEHVNDHDDVYDYDGRRVDWINKKAWHPLLGARL